MPGRFRSRQQHGRFPPGSPCRRALIDFKGETAREDRKRLVLHRLFQNRDNFTDAEIEHTVDVYACERNRLLFSDKTDADKARLRQEVVACWPFAPELLNLLEDNILMADAAQGSRDLIRTLAEVYKVRGAQSPLVTPADFSIDDDSCGVLRCWTLWPPVPTRSSSARRPDGTCRRSGTRAFLPRMPWAWSAPCGCGRFRRPTTAGGTRQEVQLDVTGGTAVDDNAFTAELAEIVDNSFNIHEVGTTEKRYCFKLPENPVSKVKAWARNDRSFEPDTAAPPGPSSRPQGPGIPSHGAQLPVQVARFGQRAAVCADRA